MNRILFYNNFHKLNNIIFNKMSKPTKETIQNLSDMAHKLRLHAIEMTDLSKSG